MIGPDALLIACIALLLVAISAIFSILRARQQARDACRAARDQSDGLRELLRTARMAETIAGIGVWHYDHCTGKQTWSKGLRRLFGIEGDHPLVEGDVETLLFASGVDLVGIAKKCSGEVGPYLVEFDFPDADGALKRMEFKACNLRDPQGQMHHTVAVVRSLTGDDHSEPRPLNPLPGRPSELCDPITGLPNRVAVMRELDRMVAIAHLKESPLVLVMFSIDCFCKINETCDERQVDVIRSQVARLAAEIACPGDIVGRIGECEFVWVIPRSSERRARILAERLRQAVSGTVSGTGSMEQLPKVTISIGYATLRGCDGPLTLFARTDKALANAASQGRNRVRTAA